MVVSGELLCDRPAERAEYEHRRQVSLDRLADAVRHRAELASARRLLADRGGSGSRSS